MMPPALTGRTKGVFLFALLVFMLLAIPKANVKLGPVPIYLIDCLILCLTAIAPRRAPQSDRKNVRFSRLLGIILALALASEVVGMITFGFIFEPIYQSIRTIMSFLLFHLTVRFIQTPSDLRLVLQASAFALLFTSLLMILTSIPLTRSFAINTFMSHDFLEPASSQVVDRFESTEARGVRGQTLVGISILSAAFINFCWPLASLLLRWPEEIGFMRRVVLIACLVAPFGAVMSYSRGAIAGSILMILCVLLINFNHVRRGILFPAAVFGVVVMLVGVGSSIFFFDRLVTRTAATFEAPLSDERESERILSYTEPFAHVFERPYFFFLGEGVTIRYQKSTTSVVPQQATKATHSVFSVAYYSYGMIAAVLYITLIYQMLIYTAAMSQSGKATISRALGQTLFLVVVGAIPWFASAHGAVSGSRGAMLLFFMAGLVASLDHFKLLDAYFAKGKPAHTPNSSMKDTLVRKLQ
jgi:hypothetical protein